jgi:hypothetical protein
MDKKDIDFFNGLIEHGMLPLFLVSLISADNIDTKETWENNYAQITKLKQYIEEIEFEDKVKYLEQINKGIEIIKRELKNYD